MNCSKSIATFRVSNVSVDVISPYVCIQSEKSVAKQIRMLADQFRIDLSMPWDKQKARSFIVVLSKRGRF